MRRLDSFPEGTTLQFADTILQRISRRTWRDLSDVTPPRGEVLFAELDPTFGKNTRVGDPDFAFDPRMN